MSNIKEVDVVRDEDGMFYHPQLPDCGDSEYFPPSWFKDNNLESQIVAMDGDVPTNVLDAWLDNGECDCSQWQPSMPDGAGWFVFGIWDTEDGPVCLWVRGLKGE